jgi:hypothetical protein
VAGFRLRPDFAASLCGRPDFAAVLPALGRNPAAGVSPAAGCAEIRVFTGGWQGGGGRRVIFGIGSGMMVGT